MRRLILAFAVVLGACGSESVTIEPGDTPEPVEVSSTTLEECVIDSGEAKKPTEPTGEISTLKEGVITVGSDIPYPPFEDLDGDTPVGFDIDIITEAAKRIDHTVDIQVAAFDTIFTAVASGKYDVAISAITIKSDRKDTVDFTDPYYEASQSLTIRTADFSKLKGVDDLDGLVVGVQDGTTGEDCAENALKAKGLVKEVRSYEKAPDVFNDLQANRIDAAIVDFPTAQAIVEEREGLAVIQKIETNENYGIAVSKERPDLRVSLNESLASMTEDGTYARFYRKWFDTDPA